MEQFRDIFKHFSPAMQKVLSYVQEARVWKLRESLPSSWVGSCGKIVLIGDAAHGALPWVGQVSYNFQAAVLQRYTDTHREEVWHSKMQQHLQNV